MIRTFFRLQYNVCYHQDCVPQLLQVPSPGVYLAVQVRWRQAAVATSEALHRGGGFSGGLGGDSSAALCYQRLGVPVRIEDKGPGGTDITFIVVSDNIELRGEVVENHSGA